MILVSTHVFSPLKMETFGIQKMWVLVSQMIFCLKIQQKITLLGLKIIILRVLCVGTKIVKNVKIKTKKYGFKKRIFFLVW